MQVAVIGDSIVGGGIDGEMGGWVNRLKVRSWAEGRGDHVFNLGLGGNSSRHILARAEGEIAARVGHIKNVIFSTGTNDMNLGMPLAEFRANLEQSAAFAVRHGKRVYFLGLFLRSDRDAAADTAAYDGVIQALCRDHGYTYIPTADVIVAADLPDGVHPAGEGHAKLAARVAEHMKD